MARKTEKEAPEKRLVAEIKEKIGEIWALDIPEDRRLHALWEISANIHVRYLADDDTFLKGKRP